MRYTVFFLNIRVYIYSSPLQFHHIYNLYIYLYLFIHVYIYIRGSQKLIKLKKYNLQNRNYNRLSLQLQRYCVCHLWNPLFFRKRIDIILFFCIYALLVHTAVHTESSGRPSLENCAIDFRRIFPFLFHFHLFHAIFTKRRTSQKIINLSVISLINPDFSKNRPITFK